MEEGGRDRKKNQEQRNPAAARQSMMSHMLHGRGKEAFDNVEKRRWWTEHWWEREGERQYMCRVNSGAYWSPPEEKGNSAVAIQRDHCFLDDAQKSLNRGCRAPAVIYLTYHLFPSTERINHKLQPSKLTLSAQVILFSFVSWPSSCSQHLRCHSTV